MGLDGDRERVCWLEMRVGCRGQAAGLEKKGTLRNLHGKTPDPLNILPVQTIFPTNHTFELKS